jgi:glucokinase
MISPTAARPDGRHSVGPVLVADIGSTNARFALATADGDLTAVEYYLLAQFDSADALVSRYLQDLDGRRFGAVCLALAGPLNDGRITLVNAPLTFDADRLATQTGCEVVRLINDFEAVANAIPALPQQKLLPIGGETQVRGVKAVLGPGTGLGMGILVPVEDDWQVVPSEGGHASLAPKDALEAEVVSILMRHNAHVSWETVVSGPGIVRLYRAVCELWGCDPEFADPKQITQRALGMADPVCHQTLELFCAMLGNAAGSLALTAGARGGVYVAGGIAPKIFDFLAASRFREHFERHGALTDYCSRIPVFVIDDPQLGLRGALFSYLRAYRRRPRRP